jgi:hypothetical protein
MSRLVALLDTLVHQVPLKWLPYRWTAWICELEDHRLGLSWEEIRANRVNWRGER